MGRKCCFHNQLATLTRPAFALYRLRTMLAMTVNELHVFLSSQLKQERERKIERLGKWQALYMRLYFPRGIRSRKWPSYAAICGVRDTAYFRRCASSSLGLFLRAYVASWLAAFRSHVLFFLFHRCELRTTGNYLLLSPALYAGVTMRTRGAQRTRSALVMKTTPTPHLRISPYKGSVATVQIQMPFHAVGRSFRPSGGS